MSRIIAIQLQFLLQKYTNKFIPHLAHLVSKMIKKTNIEILYSYKKQKI